MLILQIDQNIIIAVIGLLGAVLPVGLGYIYTNHKEFNESIRQERTKRYDDLIEVLIKIGSILHTYRPENVTHRKLLSSIMHNFVSAYHRASTYASDLVLEKCNELVAEMLKKKESEKIYVRDVMDRIVAVYVAIRLDINPKVKNSKVNALWTKVEELIEEDGKASGTQTK